MASALAIPYSDLLFTLAVDVGVREGGPDCQIVSVGQVVLGRRLLAGRPPPAASIVGDAVGTREAECVQSGPISEIVAKRLR
jgi:hypothetical protein